MPQVTSTHCYRRYNGCDGLEGKGHTNSGDIIPDNKTHGANMGPIWGRQDPGGPHICPMIFAIWVSSTRYLGDFKYPFMTEHFQCFYLYEVFNWMKYRHILFNAIKIHQPRIGNYMCIRYFHWYDEIPLRQIITRRKYLHVSTEYTSNSSCSLFLQTLHHTVIECI